MKWWQPIPCNSKGVFHLIFFFFFFSLVLTQGPCLMGTMPGGVKDTHKSLHWLVAHLEMKQKRESL